MRIIYCFLLLFLPLFGLAQNKASLDLFEEEKLPYKAPSNYYSTYDADADGVDFSEVVPFKEIDLTAYPDFVEMINENASVFAVNKIKVEDNYLLVCYVNTYDIDDGSEINQYQAVTMNKDGELIDSIVLSEESNAMEDEGMTYVGYTTSSEIMYDEFDDEYYIILVQIESKTNSEDAVGAVYSSSVTSFRRIENDAKINDVTTYWK